MAKKTIQRFLPDPNKIRHHKSLKIFGKLLQDANLWHLNRRSARGAFAVGLFFAFIPVPFQMVLAAATAIVFRVNLPISATLVWLTNPLTMPPIFYGSYLVGTLVLNQPEQHFAFELNWAWFEQSIETIGPAFLVGSLVCASIASIVGYFGIDILWRRSIVNARAARNKH
ncbi:MULTISPECIES: DUF2062 domain-containing protein [unclassified Pseudoalteromonas]|uniref:DUF2062 domain-containing protein n=1 Tax=unclassified Pseudoalteromonas TaxID=194690 RepID=UPI001108C6B8|nr:MULTISPECIES: DUF2062 domain-containing protein [unclassified Pseudoalteromonas]TMN82976.1 DUF2062 domain-containing protein [Pseudoalteromonas sp. S410]TMN90211.1 DUF2062 domain-containing protein [Pseudoalteromonas sp. S408]TMN99248.1 DUF2062 domain-containing protein [Pseudoalteromonas sp. S409]TMO00773.1 DUF2062 domain-containing protein [Pseudoalteromonas sp. S407]TMO11167.1 DUF2062 domain-containing protein [Pseudoalteromonas sp. S186]